MSNKEGMLEKWLKTPLHEEMYKFPKYREEAEEVALPREVIEEFARWLHGNSEFVARYWAGMMDDTVYADDDKAIAAANWPVFLVYKFAEDRGYRPYRGDGSGRALGDFLATYRDRVLVRGQDFEEVLARHLETSPYVRRE
jgi:hypothetical protein